MTAHGKQNSPSDANGDNKISLSIVVPAYNEEALITHTIEHLLNISRQWIDDLEIIIINDGGIMFRRRISTGSKLCSRHARSTSRSITKLTSGRPALR